MSAEINPAASPFDTVRETNGFENVLSAESELVSVKRGIGALVVRHQLSELRLEAVEVVALGEDVALGQRAQQLQAELCGSRSRIPRMCEYQGMYYPDLGREWQIAFGDSVRAVGWLSAQFPFSQGPTPNDLVPALRVLIRRGWVPFAAAGSHACELCPGEAHRESANVLVPTEQLLYAAPAMIVHYVEEHSYRPPEEFVKAVLECPLPGTAAYEARLMHLLGCWSEFVPIHDLERFVRQHRAEQAALGEHFGMADGTTALGRVRDGDNILEFATIEDAEFWAARLLAAGATIRVWNGGRYGLAPREIE